MLDLLWMDSITISNIHLKYQYLRFCILDFDHNTVTLPLPIPHAVFFCVCVCVSVPSLHFYTSPLFDGQQPTKAAENNSNNKHEKKEEKQKEENNTTDKVNEVSLTCN